MVLGVRGSRRKPHRGGGPAGGPARSWPDGKGTAAVLLGGGKGRRCARGRGVLYGAAVQRCRNHKVERAGSLAPTTACPCEVDACGLQSGGRLQGIEVAAVPPTWNAAAGAVPRAPCAKVWRSCSPCRRWACRGNTAVSGDHQPAGCRAHSARARTLAARGLPGRRGDGPALGGRGDEGGDGEALQEGAWLRAVVDVGIESPRHGVIEEPAATCNLSCSLSAAAWVVVDSGRTAFLQLWLGQNQLACRLKCQRSAPKIKAFSVVHNPEIMCFK